MAFVVARTFGDKIINPSQIFFETKLSFAFVNIKPVLPGHILISPLRPVKRFADLTEAEVSDIFLLVKRFASKLEAHYNCSSLSINIQDGLEAGQSVEHVHIHVLPRKKDDFTSSKDFYKKLHSHDKGGSLSNFRSEQDMAQEADTLKKLFNN